MVTLCIYLKLIPGVICTTNKLDLIIYMIFHSAPYTLGNKNK